MESTNKWGFCVKREKKKTMEMSTKIENYSKIWFREVGWENIHSTEAVRNRLKHKFCDYGDEHRFYGTENTLWNTQGRCFSFEVDEL